MVKNQNQEGSIGVFIATVFLLILLSLFYDLSGTQNKSQFLFIQIYFVILHFQIQLHLRHVHVYDMEYLMRYKPRTIFNYDVC